MSSDCLTAARRCRVTSAPGAPQIGEDEPDPLDAFMEGEVLPEVAAKAAAEAADREAVRLKKAQERAVRSRLGSLVVTTSGGFPV